MTSVQPMAVVMTCEECSYGYYVKQPVAVETACENCGHVNQTPASHVGKQFLIELPRPLGVAVNDNIQLMERIG